MDVCRISTVLYLCSHPLSPYSVWIQNTVNGASAFFSFCLFLNLVLILTLTPVLMLAKIVLSCDFQRLYITAMQPESQVKKKKNNTKQNAPVDCHEPRF